MSQKIYEIIQRIDYFKNHPHYLNIHQIPHDYMNRTYVTAFMKGKKKSNKTVILLSHLDTVGVEEYGSFKKLAFNPVEYTEYLKNNHSISLSQEALEDLKSGDFLFGRGIMDMKYGIAAGIEVLYQIEEIIDNFEGNILLVSVPDEEANSAGMLAAVETLLSMKIEKELEYICAIISEPHFPKYPGDNHLYIYNGTVGKLLPVFYCVGKETHVGEPFAGLNPNLLTAKIIEKIDQSPFLCDYFQQAAGPVPTCLKQSDTKNEYSVQTPTAAYTYFNFITLNSTPKEILYRLKEIADTAFMEVLEDIKEKSYKFEDLTGNRPRIPEVRPKVMFYHELYDLCYKVHGETFKNHINNFIASIETKDLRQSSIELVKEIHHFSPYRDPMIILFLAPPYYPHSVNMENTKIIEVCKYILNIAKEKFNRTISLEPFFPGLSDMSYLGMINSIDEELLKLHFPLWGEKYSIPIKTISQLNIPFLNIGPLGKDAHKYTERICLSYSLETASFLIYEAVLKSLKTQG